MATGATSRSSHTWDLLLADLAIERGYVSPNTAATIVLQRIEEGLAQPSRVESRLALAGNLDAEEIVCLRLETQALLDAAASPHDALFRRGGLDLAMEGHLARCHADDTLPFSASLDPSTYVLPPDRYARFELIARGAHAYVFRARDRLLGRDVAMKVLRPTSCDGAVVDPFEIQRPASRGARQRLRDACDRFLLEARRSAAMRHPGILPIHDVGITPHGIPLFTAQAESGLTLHDALVDGSLDPVQGLAIVRNVAHAIAYAHDARGIVHCDLSASNVLVAGAGKGLVIDWGSALRKGKWTTPGRPDDGAVESWKAPELQEDPCRILPTIDVHALGMLLLHVLLAEPLSPNCAVPSQCEWLQNQLKLARSKVDFVRIPLVDLCLSCLDREPDKRPGRAAEVARALDAALSRLSHR